MTKRRHLIYIRFAFPLTGEPGPKRPREIVERYAEQGDRVTVITSGGNFMTGKAVNGKSAERDRYRKRGIQFCYTPAFANYRKSLVRRLANYALFTLAGLWRGLMLRSAAAEPTIIFVDISPPFAALGGFFLAKFRRRWKLALEVTDLPESVFAVGLFERQWIQRVTRRIFGWIYHAADSIVTLTPGARRHIIEQGIAPEKIHVVPNWISGPEINNRTQESRGLIRAKHGWDNRFIIMYAGGMGMAYDIPTLLKAAEVLRSESQLRFVLMGAGERKPDYMAFCQAHHLTNVEFLPPVPQEELKLYLSAADVCTNLFYRGEFWSKVVGHKIFDYLQAGRPIVFAGIGDTADLIDETGGGVVVPPEDPRALADAIRELAANPNRTADMGINGRTYLKRHYHREIQLGKLDRIFNQIWEPEQCPLKRRAA